MPRGRSLWPNGWEADLKKLLLALLLLMPGLTPGMADEPAKVKAPDFVPLVMDQNQYQAAMQYLGGLKFSDAAPMVKWLNELEERAKGQWEADHAPKPAEAPK